jgi:hypothetical protein
MKPTICLLLVLFTKPCLCQTDNFTSSNLPIIVINTLGNTIADDPKVDATMGIIYNGDGIRNNLTDPQNNYSGNIGIEYRGKSSQMFPMKSYGIELRDASNNSQEKTLLGIPKESDWVLYAPYTDKTLMRNVLAYTLSNRLGHWASQCRYVELVVNDEYRGIYVLMEKIKRGSSNRVVISKLGANDNSGDAVTGGYLISIDKDPAAFTSRYPPANAPDKQIRFSNVYPKENKITPQQNSYIQHYVDSFETALKNNNYQDPISGVRKYANLPSFIDYFLINEFSHNVDGYRLSTYLYKDKKSIDGKLYIGPVWDYDLAFRNADYCGGSYTSTWAYQFNNICPDDYYQVPFWWEKLMTDTAFTGSLNCRYTEARQNIFSAAGINAMIDSIQNLLNEAQVRHFEKWPVLGQYVWPNPQPIPTSYAGEINALKNWIQTRTKWLDLNIPNKGACATIEAGSGISIKVAPNPVTTNGEFLLTSDSRQTVMMVICNSIGQTLYKANISVHPGTNHLKNISFAEWQNGTYFIKVFAANGQSTMVKMILLK